MSLSLGVGLTNACDLACAHCLNLVVRELPESCCCSCYLRRVYERDINFERDTSGGSIYCAAERRFAPHSLDGRGKFRREDVGRSEEPRGGDRRPTCLPSAFLQSGARRATGECRGAAYHLRDPIETPLRCLE